MTSRLIRQHCQLDESASALLQEAMIALNLSARAYDRILRVSRTIADLSESPAILPEHVQEAVAYRTLDRGNSLS